MFNGIRIFADFETLKIEALYATLAKYNIYNTNLNIAKHIGEARTYLPSSTYIDIHIEKHDFQLLCPERDVLEVQTIANIDKLCYTAVMHAHKMIREENTTVQTNDKTNQVDEKETTKIFADMITNWNTLQTQTIEQFINDNLQVKPLSVKANLVSQGYHNIPDVSEGTIRTKKEKAIRDWLDTNGLSQDKYKLENTKRGWKIVMTMYEPEEKKILGETLSTIINQFVEKNLNAENIRQELDNRGICCVNTESNNIRDKEKDAIDNFLKNSLKYPKKLDVYRTDDGWCFELKH